MAKTKTQPELRFAGFTEDWEEEKLRDLADFSKGNGYSKSDLTEKGNPILLYGRLYTNYEIVIKHVETFVNAKGANVLSKGGEVVIPASGETQEDIVRASVVEQKNIIIGGDLNIVIPNGKLNSVFLALTISNGKVYKDLVKRAQGKSVVHIRNNDLKDAFIPYPEIDEQKLIGNFFENLDKLITEHQQKHTKLKSLKQAMLDKMFPKQGQTVPEIRFKGFEGDWVEYELNDLCTLITKQTGFDYSAIIKPSLTRRYTNSTYSFIQNKDFESTNINLTTDFYIPKNIAENYPNILIDRPSILISISGKIGNVGLYQLSEKAFVGGAVGICKLTNESDGLIILYKLLSNSGQNYFQSLIKASSHSNITVYDIRKIKVQIPNSNDERIKIGNYFKNLDELIDNHETQITKLQNIKKALLAKMFI